MTERYYNQIICDVCGNKVHMDKILGKCIKCGKIVCKSGCGQKVLLWFPLKSGFPAGVYCRDCINKKNRRKIRKGK